MALEIQDKYRINPLFREEGGVTVCVLEEGQPEDYHKIYRTVLHPKRYARKTVSNNSNISKIWIQDSGVVLFDKNESIDI